MKTIRVQLLMALAWLALPVSVLAFYNPEEGRWLSRDPVQEIAFSGTAPKPVESSTIGFNDYGFVRNDVISRTDYLGLRPIGGCCGDYRMPHSHYPHTCSEICAMAAEAAKKGDIWVGGGNVICFGDKACPCIFPWPKVGYEPGKCPKIDEAFLKHETNHVPKADCGSCGLYAAGIKGDLTEEECRERTATVAELKALEGTITPDCWNVAARVISVLEEWLNENCEGGHKKQQ